MRAVDDYQQSETSQSKLTAKEEFAAKRAMFEKIQCSDKSAYVKRMNQMNSNTSCANASYEVENIDEDKYIDYDRKYLRNLKENIFGNLKPDTSHYNLVKDFMDQEIGYVAKLERLEEQMSKLRAIHIPECDLKNIFGYTSEIKKLHKIHVSNTLLKCKSVEDILDFFYANRTKFDVYVYDQCVKRKDTFVGKSAILKRFDSRELVEDLELPKRRMVNYLEFHMHVEPVDDGMSEKCKKSLNAMTSIFTKMQYIEFIDMKSSYVFI